MEQYKNVIRDLISRGVRAPNRTGIDTLFLHGRHMTFDLQQGFPLLTLRKMPWKSVFAEMMGFVRGYDNAADFRALGTPVWNANANENQAWLDNPNRIGEDDLGRIYGVQARDWKSNIDWPQKETRTDQLLNVYSKLMAGKDDRRLIVTHWNPGELHTMALPPCHLMYQFGKRGQYLDLAVYIRSNDVGLGMPFNIAGYAWLLSVMAHITGHLPGDLHYFAFNYHIYDNHMDQMMALLSRENKPLPNLYIAPEVNCLANLELASMDCFKITNYDPHPAVSMPMAV